MATGDDSKSIFHKTGVWKQGLIANVSMLARGDMVKPARGTYGADSRFTRVQEMKQDKLAKVCQCVVFHCCVCFWFVMVCRCTCIC